jgi:hypothetical protein
MRRTFAALLVLAALSLAGAAIAQTPGETSVSGVVVSSTSDALLIRLDDGSQRTFVTDFTTTLPAARLVEGNRVTVRYSPLEGGRFQAVSVASTAADASPRALPDTASDTPLVALVGAAALAGTLALAALRRMA